MSEKMNFQLILSGECFRALRAPEGLLPGVNAKMIVQTDFSGKCRRAGSARERLHTGVSANVNGQIGLGSTLLMTEGTLEGQLIGVHQKVIPKADGGGELLEAHSALKRRFSQIGVVVFAANMLT